LRKDKEEDQLVKHKDTGLYLLLYIPIRHGSHWEVKSMRWTWRYVNSWNNLGFSLCAALSVCCVVAISENGKKYEIEVSADLVCCH